MRHMPYRALGFIVLFSFALRMLLRSDYLDDWDSVQFVLALGNYSIVYHQPHPPGYPVYIFLGRALNMLLDNGQLSLTVMSAIFGSLCLIPTYLLSRELFEERTATVAAIILSLAPAALIFSEVVMSDTVSMFFVAATAYLLFLGISSRKHYYLAAFTLGITIGVRQTDFMLIPLFLLVAVYRRDLRDLVSSSAIMLASVLSWLVPVILDTGIKEFAEAQRLQGQIALQNGTLYGAGWLNPEKMMHFLQALFSLFVEGWSIQFIAFLGLTIVAALMRIKAGKIDPMDKRMIFLMTWLVPYLLVFTLAYQLYIPRYLLPVFPPLAIIFASSMVSILKQTRKRWQRGLVILIFVVLISAMGGQALHQAYDLHNSIPAPVQAAQFIQKNYDPERTLIIAGNSFRHFQYYLPGHTVKLNWFTAADDWYLTPERLCGYLMENRTIISEGEPISFADSARPMQFAREGRIYPKHELVALYEYDNDNTLNLSIFKGEGWHGQESWSGVPTRWMAEEATLLLPSDANRSVDLEFIALAFGHNRTLEVWSQDGLLASRDVGESLTEIRVPLILRSGCNIIRLRVTEGCERPCDRMESDDCRCISVALQELRI